MSSHESVPSDIREDIQEALGCGHYEKLMNDDWLFEGNWLDLTNDLHPHQPSLFCNRRVC